MTNTENDLNRDAVLVDEKDQLVVVGRETSSSPLFRRSFALLIFDAKNDEILLRKVKVTEKETLWTTTCHGYPQRNTNVPMETEKSPDSSATGGIGNAAVRFLSEEYDVPKTESSWLLDNMKWMTRVVLPDPNSKGVRGEMQYVGLLILQDKSSLCCVSKRKDVSLCWVTREQLCKSASHGFKNEQTSEGALELSSELCLISRRFLFKEIGGRGWWAEKAGVMTTQGSGCTFGANGGTIHLLDDDWAMSLKGKRVIHTADTESNGNCSDIQNSKEIRGPIDAPYFVGKVRPLVLIFLLGLSMASLASSAFYMYKIYFPEQHDAFSFSPAISYEQTIYLSGISIFLLVFFILQTQSEIRLASLNMPVVPSSLPYFGSVPEFLQQSPWNLMSEWHRKYGPVYAFNLLGRTCVAVSEPEYLRIVLQSRIGSVKKDVDFAYKPFLSILGRGIVTSEGHNWMKQRLKMSTALRIDVLDVIPRITLGAVQRLMKKMDRAAVDGSTVELAEELRHLTLQVISETFLSLSPEESDTTFARLYLPIVEESNKRVWHPERGYMFFTSTYWNYLKNVGRLNRYVSGLIRNRWNLRQSEKGSGKQGQREEDILDRVLANYEKEYPGRELTESSVKQLCDELKTFMLAGHETSAAMMTWALYELMGNENLMKQVAAEAESIFGKPREMDWCRERVDHTNLPSKDELSKLILAEGCLKEALRKYSVVPAVQRRVVSPVHMGSHVLPKGCSIMISIQAVHHDPKFWPNPMKFDPYRFADPDKKPEPYTFLPFIEGPRNCLGQYLALLESKMLLSLLTQRYCIRYAGSGIMTDLNDKTKDPRHRYMVPVVPKADVNIFVSRRDQ